MSRRHTPRDEAAEVEAAPVTADPTVDIAVDLREIERLADRLAEEAVAHGDDPHIPGGAAMIAGGPVASLEAWEYRQQTTERTGRPYSSAVDEDDPDEHPLHRLLFWSEDLRRTEGHEYDGWRPTLTTEASYLRHMLGHIWDTELRWGDFAADVRAARIRLEGLLSESRRPEHGVPCFTCEVDLIRLSRPRSPHPADTGRGHCEGHGEDGARVCTVPHVRCPHDRGGLRDEWECPECRRRYGIEDYRRAVSQAAVVHADWLPLIDCAERTGVKAGTVKVWANRGKVHKRRDVETGRMLYRVSDVEAARDRDEVLAG